MRKRLRFLKLLPATLLLAGVLAIALSLSWAFQSGAAAPVASSSLTCTVKDSACVGDEVEVFRMSNTANAHAGTPTGSSYTCRVCCGGVDGLGADCSGTYDTVLALSGSDNAHAATTAGGDYTTEVCLSVSSGTADCTSDPACAEGYACVATVSGETNAHVADCDGTDDYTTKVCCQVEGGADCSPGVDTDGDGFNNDIECYLPTDPADDCPDVVGSDDAWPLDINMDTYVTVVGDVLAYRGHIGKDVATYPEVKRLDLNVDGYITVVGDVLMYRGKIGASCT
jgi:hypothetical protein